MMKTNLLRPKATSINVISNFYLFVADKKGGLVKFLFFCTVSSPFSIPFLLSLTI